MVTKDKMTAMFTELLTHLVGTTHALKMAHWSIMGPGSYAFHVASGELADALFANTDMLIEALMAYSDYSNGLQSVVINLPQQAFGGASGRSLAVQEVRSLQKAMRKLETWDEPLMEKRTEILTIRDEILRAIDSFLYKLRFM